MITVKTNIAPVVLRIVTGLTELADKDKMLKACAVGILPVIKDRIHQDGQDQTGGQIGTYSPGYMKVRTGNFKNSGRNTKGKNKGKLKDSGVFTKRGVATPFGKSKIAFQNIEDEGVFRPKYNRSADTKVVASLTRQLENDYITEPTENGYGIGFSNPFNKEKSDHVEETYKKKIWETTDKENALIVEIATNYIKNESGF